MCRIDDEIVRELSQMLTYNLEIVNLSHNKITKDGIVHIADKFKSLASQPPESRPRIHTLSLKSNEMNDFAIDGIKDIV